MTKINVASSINKLDPYVISASHIKEMENRERAGQPGDHIAQFSVWKTLKGGLVKNRSL